MENFELLLRLMFQRIHRSQGMLEMMNFSGKNIWYSCYKLNLHERTIFWENIAHSCKDTIFQFVLESNSQPLRRLKKNALFFIFQIFQPVLCKSHGRIYFSAKCKEFLLKNGSFLLQTTFDCNCLTQLEHPKKLEVVPKSQGKSKNEQSTGK